MLQGMRLRTLVRAIYGGALALVPCGPLLAQDATPEEEYKKYLEVNAGLAPLPENAFGEEVSLYSGTIGFRQVDVRTAGDGPTIEVARTYRLNDRDTRLDLVGRAFGDWELDLPSIVTTTAQQNNVQGWVVSSSTPGAICSSFGPPPIVRSPPGDPARHAWEVRAWWSGYQLHIPGVGDQELLRRVAGNPSAPTYGGLLYPIVTKENWALGCLAQASNDLSVQGFLAIAPDGTRYTLDHLSYRWMPNIERPLGSGGARFPQSDILMRREGRMLVTHVEDRFGNSIHYHYNGDSVTDITASDGRHVSIGYEPGTTRIASVTLMPGHPQARTWHYSYAPIPLGVTLTGVTEPNGGAWWFGLASLTNDAHVEIDASGTCNRLANATNAGQAYTGAMVHPSGLSGEFTVTPLRRGRSGIYRECWAGPSINPLPNAPGTFASQPNAWWDMAITSRRYWGAGMDERRWSYGYSPSNESWLQDCGGGCASTVFTDITFPDGHAERRTFSNEATWREGLEVYHEIFEGAPGTTIKRITSTAFVAPDPGVDARAAAYPHPWGTTPKPRANRDQVNEKIPVGERVTMEWVDTYAWQAATFDAFARATTINRNSSLGYALSMRQTFYDHHPLWVLGQTQETANLTAGRTVDQYTYNEANGTLASHTRFGQKVMDYRFAPGGQLEAFTDAAGSATWLGNYKRGIPRSITFPDHTTTGIDVDDFGQVTAIADQAGATTTYGYDAVGRLASVNPPQEEGYPAHARAIVHQLVDSERGIVGPHWRTTSVEGSKVETIHYNAMMQPILHSVARSDGALGISRRTAYDWRDQPSFVSIPYDGHPSIDAMMTGRRTYRDVIGRPTVEQEDSELGVLTTTTDYITGNAVRTTSPRGQVTTRWYQGFDAPSYESIVRIEAPEGVTQTVSRDGFGAPLAITQTGGGLSHARRYIYDAEHRVCRFHEPESDSRVTAYDVLGNPTWSAAGLSIGGDGCGLEQVADQDKTRYAYDSMGRVTSVIPPVGTAPTTYTYDARGEVATSTAGDIGWVYARNRRGQLVQETLNVDGWSWPIAYAYDPSGAMSNIRYPDGKEVPLEPDVHGRPTRAGDFVSQASYDASHALTGYIDRTGVAYLATHNVRGLVDRLDYRLDGAIFRVSAAYRYDAMGNLVWRDGPDHNANEVSMTYDLLDRILSETGNRYRESAFTYDAMGNVTSIDFGSHHRQLRYDERMRLSSVAENGDTARDVRSDARGNIVSDGLHTFAFDRANRMVEMSGNRDMAYDAKGNRVREHLRGSDLIYYAYASGHLMWEYDARTTRGTDYIYLGNRLVASTVHSVSAIVGAIDGIEWNGDDAILSGWACSTGFDTSVDVHLYAGPTAATYLKRARADLPSDGSLHGPCHASGNTYRFSIPLTEEERVKHALEPLTVYGISPVENENLPIAGSGSVEMPPSKLAPKPTSSVTAARETNDERDVVNVSWIFAEPVTRSRVEASRNGAHWRLVEDTGTSASAWTVNEDGQFRFSARGCNEHGCGYRTPSDAIDIVRIPWHPGRFTIPDGRILNHIAASWSPIRHADRYEVDGYNHNDGAVWGPLYGGADLAASLAPASSGTHSLRIRGCNANGCGEYAQRDGVDVVVAPRDRSALSGGGSNNNGSYGMSWTAVKDAVSYQLQESTNGSAWIDIHSTPSLGWSVADKDNGSHSYRVRPCNDAGCADWSDAVTMVVDRLPVFPTALYIRLTPGGKFEHYDASWPAVRYAATYEVMALPPAWTVYQGAEREVRLESGPAPYPREFTYKLRACNHVGCSDWFGPK